MKKTTSDNDIFRIHRETQLAFHRLRLIETTDLEFRVQERLSDGSYQDVSSRRRAEISDRDLSSRLWFEEFAADVAF